MSVEYTTEEDIRPYPVRMYIIWHSLYDNPEADPAQSRLRLFAGPIERKPAEKKQRGPLGVEYDSYFYFTEEISSDPLISIAHNYYSWRSLVRGEPLTTLPDPPTYYIMLHSFPWYLSQSQRENIIKTAEKIELDSRSEYKIILIPSRRPGGIRGGVELLQDILAFGAANIEKDNVKSTAHKIVDGYKEIVNTCDDIDFPYAKRWLEKIHKAIDGLDLDSEPDVNTNIFISRRRVPNVNFEEGRYWCCLHCELVKDRYHYHCTGLIKDYQEDGT